MLTRHLIPHYSGEGKTCVVNVKNVMNISVQGIKHLKIPNSGACIIIGRGVTRVSILFSNLCNLQNTSRLLAIVWMPTALPCRRGLSKLKVTRLCLLPSTYGWIQFVDLFPRDIPHGLPDTSTKSEDEILINVYNNKSACNWSQWQTY